MVSTQLTIFHVTHWKAGSQWIAEILKHSAPERFIPWRIADPSGMGGIGTPGIYIEPLIPGKIYGTVYLSRDRFYKLIRGFFWRAKKGTLFYPRRLLGNLWNYRIKRSPFRCFIVIRDLRDTLTSFYFSTKYSHEISADVMTGRKQLLNTLSEEDGLLYMLDEVLSHTARMQASYINWQDSLLLRYEDILGNEQPFFERLIDYCQIDVSQERLRDIVYYNTFEIATGRKRGQEDANAHLRKGIAGDWRNYFTDRVKVEFKKKYGQLLIDTGYEKDLDW